MPIIPATLADVPDLTALINSSYRGEGSKKGWTTEADLIDGQRIDHEGLTQQMQDPNAVIFKNVDDNGKITGCVYLQKRIDKLYVGMLTVSPLLQANGLGRQLLQVAEDYAKSVNYHILTMTVITTREELIGWYERRGYMKTGEVIPLIITEKFGVLKQPLEMFKLDKTI